MVLKKIVIRVRKIIGIAYWIFSFRRIISWKIPDSSKRVLVIWNFFTDLYTVGDFIDFLEFTLVLREIYKIDKIDICFLCDPKEPARRDFVEEGITKDNYFIYLEKMINLAYIHPYLGSFLIFDSGAYLEDYIADNYFKYKTIWPHAFKYASKTPEYPKIFSEVSLFYKMHGYIPGPPMKKQFLNWAQYFFKEHSKNHIPIVVQWRKTNNQGSDMSRNTIEDVWLDFFDYCAEKHSEVLFFVICTKNEIDCRLRERKNIFITKDFNTTISEDLALILKSIMYIGPTSGPAQMAMFSNVPYIIVNFVPCNVTRKLNENLDFATPLQRLIWKPETFQILVDEFEDIFSKIDIKKWQSEFFEKYENIDPFTSHRRLK